MSASTKDTIYIDVDDEITGIINKVQASKHKIVALVLPKRATTLQSIVNMKLLKRTGQETDKRIVLITSETSLIPLAGIVGLHVAKTLQSKPAIPPTPKVTTASETLVDEDTAEPEIDTTKPIGELAGLPPEPDHMALGTMAVEETIDVDNTVADATTTLGKDKSDKSKIKIPNFESFRLRLFLGILALIILIVGWVFAFKILPKASVTVKTVTKTVASSISFTANTSAKTVDTDKFVIPADQKEVKKTDVLKVTATGKKNNGVKATGTMTVTNCINDGVSHTVPAGTSFSSGSLTFVTNKDVILDAALFSGSSCKSANFGLSKDVAVTASQSGDNYNLSARSYTSSIAGITGYGSAMSGGTTVLVTAISQLDIDNAKAQLTDKSKDSASTDLIKLITDAKLIPITESLNSTAPVITSSPNVGDESADVTVTAVTTYDMLGIKHENLEKLITVDVKKQLDITKQPINDYGLLKATYHVTDKRSGTDQTVALQTIVTVGSKLDAESLKKEIIGKKRGDVQQIISAHPGVKDVTVNYSPFWVSVIPSKTARTTIVFEQVSSNAK